jgi:hypothetical protein
MRDSEFQLSFVFTTGTQRHRGKTGLLPLRHEHTCPGVRQETTIDPIGPKNPKKLFSVTLRLCGEKSLYPIGSGLGANGGGPGGGGGSCDGG